MLTYFRIATRIMVNYCSRFKTRAHSQRALMESNGSANEPHKKFWINKRRTGSGKCAAMTEPNGSTNELLEKNWINKRRTGSGRCAAMTKSNTDRLLAIWTSEIEFQERAWAKHSADHV